MYDPIQSRTDCLFNHDESRTYLNRKISEGNTRREAMRSLKRHVSRRLYHRLTQTPLTP